LESHVSLRTVNERINQIEPLLEQARRKPISEVPAVVQCDGIWLRLQVPSETLKVDKRQRKRQKRRGKKMVRLLALGLWSAGKREILDWEVADGEDKASWQRLLKRLHERGVQPENGLQAVIRDGCGEVGKALALVSGSSIVEQRCIFHKLDNVAEKCREELKGEEHKPERKQLMEQARAVSDAQSAAEARVRLAAFAHRWQAQAPKTVATFERDFEQTIAYYRLEGLPHELIRSTSLLERTNRELRRKFRQVCCFGSLKGALVAIYLQVQRLNARWPGQMWGEVSQTLSLDFLTLNP
jgi:putative transposase